MSREPEPPTTIRLSRNTDELGHGEIRIRPAHPEAPWCEDGVVHLAVDDPWGETAKVYLTAEECTAIADALRALVP
jgi:hypothetical protein